MSKDYFWNSCLERLEMALPEGEFNAYFRLVRPTFKNDILHLNAPNPYFVEELKLNYLDKITEVASAVHGKPVRVVIGTTTGNSSIRSKNGKAGKISNRKSGNGNATGNNKLPYGFSPLNPEFTFDQHIEGGSNTLARRIARAVSEDPGVQNYNPFFIYGKVGVGKTHLMQAAGHAIKELNPDAKVGFARSQNYINQLVMSFKRKDHEHTERFKEAYRNLDVLLFDDIHMFSGAFASQAEFLHTFNVLTENKKQIIITSDRFFKNLDEMTDRLISRLGQGISIMVKPPEFEVRIAILESKAEQQGIQLKKTVSHFLADKIQSSVREMEGALNTIIAVHNFKGLPITIEMVKDELADLFTYNARPVNIVEIKKTIANFYEIRIEDLDSKSRKAKHVKPRQIAMLLCRELTDDSLPKIGKAFGGRNHATVMHACNKVKKNIETDFNVANEFKTLFNILSP